VAHKVLLGTTDARFQEWVTGLNFGDDGLKGGGNSGSACGLDGQIEGKVDASP